MENKQVFDAYTYPTNGAYVIYYFEPFERWYVGTFEQEGEFGPMIFGKAGFSTWHPEVTKWMEGE